MIQHTPLVLINGCFRQLTTLSTAKTYDEPERFVVANCCSRAIDEDSVVI